MRPWTPSWMCPDVTLKGGLLKKQALLRPHTVRCPRTQMGEHVSNLVKNTTLSKAEMRCYPIHVIAVVISHVSMQKYAQES